MAAKYVRQLDKMGRVVIPKDIREDLDLKGRHLGVYEIGSGRGIKVINEEAEGEVKTLDRYGRIVIPIELRQLLHWEEGKQVEIKVNNKEVIISDQSQVCAVCEHEQSLFPVKSKYLCEDCLEDGNLQMSNRWASKLDSLIKEYREHCRNALNFEDPEDIHQARVKGRRIEALLQFLNVSSHHEIFQNLKEAHKLLGAVRERDVLINGFEIRAQEEENQNLADVYAQVYQRVFKKREKHRKKLAEKLPEVISERFYDQWNAFVEDNIRQYVMALNIKQRLDVYEKRFNQAVDGFNEVSEEKGRSSKKALKALHDVRIESKYLRYIYKYLDEIYEEDFQEQVDFYEKLQDEFGNINDLKDWLDAFEKHFDKLESKKKHKKAVKQQMQDELAEKMNQVTIETKSN
ncbi:CHAD domain-containing protein [Halobacillus sp. B23F22_1]|uniref:CHAD domain-containing protein n=1 Tax=Halobacillus sp. B23F22_1 TaxID=3459514 RepID=UPI00373FC54A